MKRTLLKIGIILIIIGFMGVQASIQADENPINLQNTELDADPFAENEDPLNDSPNLDDEDPLSEDSDPLMDDDSEKSSNNKQNSEPETDFKPRLNFKQNLTAQIGYVEQENGGIVNSNTEGLEIKNKAFFFYDYKIKIQTSPYSYFFSRVEAFGKSEYTRNTKRYSDDYDTILHETYYQNQSGRNRFKVGLQKIQMGRVDIESPINVLNKSNSIGKEALREESFTLPVMGTVYDWLGDQFSFSFYTAPFRVKTPGTEYSYTAQDEETEAKGDTPEDRSVARPYYGLTTQLSAGDFTLRLGAFQWFDSDNKIAWTQKGDQQQQSQNSLSVDSTYSEEEVKTRFLSMDWEYNMDNWLLKGDFGWFEDKNIYHFFKDSSTDSREFNTLQVKYFSYAVTLERKWDNLFLMPGYSYKKLYNVPAGSHILFYENEKTIPDKERDLKKSTYSLAIMYQFGDDVSFSLLAQETNPFKEARITSTLLWNPDNSGHTFKLKLASSKSEVIESTNLPVGANIAYLNYTYQF